MMNTSNNKERTIPRGDGMDAELISRLEQRLIDTEERLEENRRLIEEKGRLIEEKEKGMVWHKRILYGVIVVRRLLTVYVSTVRMPRLIRSRKVSIKSTKSTASS